jgi:hypothetical protein
MSRETTHRIDTDTGSYIQVVSPERLRDILDADGETYDRPDHMTDVDQWGVADD